jgi:hypothetical protein
VSARGKVSRADPPSPGGRDAHTKPEPRSSTAAPFSVSHLQWDGQTTRPILFHSDLQNFENSFADSDRAVSIRDFTFFLTFMGANTLPTIHKIRPKSAFNKLRSSYAHLSARYAKN